MTGKTIGDTVQPGAPAITDIRANKTLLHRRPRSGPRELGPPPDGERLCHRCSLPYGPLNRTIRGYTLSSGLADPSVASAWGGDGEPATGAHCVLSGHSEQPTLTGQVSVDSPKSGGSPGGSGIPSTRRPLPPTDGTGGVLVAPPSSPYPYDVGPSGNLTRLAAPGEGEGGTL